MKKIREWSPSMKVLVGLGMFVATGIVMFLPLIGSTPEQATISPLFHVMSLAGMGGLILFIWGLGQWLWGIGQGVEEHPRIKGALFATAGLVLTAVTVINLPRIWEWSKGGVVNFIPAPFLVPLVPALPAILLFYGIAEMLRK